MKLKLSFTKVKENLLDTDEQKMIRGTLGRYKLIEKSAPLAEQENDTEFRSFPDFDFLQVPVNYSISRNLFFIQESGYVPESYQQPSKMISFSDVKKTVISVLRSLKQSISKNKNSYNVWNRRIIVTTEHSTYRKMKFCRDQFKSLEYLICYFANCLNSVTMSQCI